VTDPEDPETLYALVPVQSSEGANALWKSTDGGQTWKSIQNGIGPANFLVVDPLRPGRLYAWEVTDYSQPKLWVSENGGESWRLRYAAVPNSDEPHFWQIIASPLREGVLYGWVDSRVSSFGSDIYRSNDGGATWTRRGTVGDSRVSLESLLHHPTRNRLEFFDNAAFYTSNDNGLTWTAYTYRGDGFRLVTRSNAAPDRLYAIPFDSSPCVVRSDNGGTSWSKTRSQPAFSSKVMCTGLAVDPHDPDLLAVTAEGQVGRQYAHLLSISHDGGATWSRPRAFPRSFPLWTGDDAGTLFAAGVHDLVALGPYRSTDEGLTWTPSWDGIAAGDFRGGFVAVATSGPNPILVANVTSPALLGAPLWRSEDGGVTWENLALPGEYLGVFADADGRTLYLKRHDTSRLLESTDAGRTWTEVSRIPANLYSLLPDPSRSRRIFAANDEGSRVTLWRTLDGGRSWARRSAGLPVACAHIASVDLCPSFYAVASDPRDPDHVVISFGGAGFFSPTSQIFVSTDGGTRWRAAAQSPPLTLTLAADPGTPSAFLAGTSQGIYRSVDGGDHWTKLQPGLPVEAPVVQLLRDAHSGAWYAVTNGHGIFRSTDGGAAWSRISEGQPDFTAPRVVVDPQTADRLFAAFPGQGVWSWSAPGS
jgi:photosystem II stability/assembly factor-like uncharacterized protein